MVQMVNETHGMVDYAVWSQFPAVCNLRHEFKG